jgi:hypothetical protein
LMIFNALVIQSGATLCNIPSIVVSKSDIYYKKRSDVHKYLEVEVREFINLRKLSILKKSKRVFLWRGSVKRGSVKPDLNRWCNYIFSLSRFRIQITQVFERSENISTISR